MGRRGNFVLPERLWDDDRGQPFFGVRCGEAFDIGAVRRGRTDDDINCLSVPADYIKNDNVRKMIEVFWRQSLAGKRDISGGWGNWRAWVEEAVRMGL